jgi:hypothetical protein
MVRSQWGKSGPVAVRAVVNSPLRLAMRSPERGADTIVWLATTTPGKEWPNGGYFANRKPATPNPLADDTHLAGQLWERSAAMCGLQAEPGRGGPRQRSDTILHADKTPTGRAAWHTCRACGGISGRR